MCMRKIERELVKRAALKGTALFFYSPVEIAKMTKTSISNISKELKVMVERGILKENSVLPFKKTYRLNKEYFKANYCINTGERIAPIAEILEE